MSAPFSPPPRCRRRRAPRRCRSSSSPPSPAPCRRRPGRRSIPLAQALDELVQADLALAAQAFGDDDGLHLADAVLEVAIDQDVIVFGPMAHFVGGLGHASRHLDGAVAGAGGGAPPPPPPSPRPPDQT